MPPVVPLIPALTPRRRRLAATALVFALLWAQWLVLLHGVHHPHAPHAALGESGAAEIGDIGESVADHDPGSLVCRSIDQLAHGLPTPPPAVALASFVVSESIPAPAARPPASAPPRPYLARAPPVPA